MWLHSQHRWIHDKLRRYGEYISVHLNWVSLTTKVSKWHHSYSTLFIETHAKTLQCSLSDALNVFSRLSYYSRNFLSCSLLAKYNFTLVVRIPWQPALSFWSFAPVIHFIFFPFIKFTANYGIYFKSVFSLFFISFSFVHFIESFIRLYKCQIQQHLILSKSLREWNSCKTISVFISPIWLWKK